MQCNHLDQSVSTMLRQCNHDQKEMWDHLLLIIEIADRLPLL